jgi:SAM-dependent methyltransferase
MFAARPERVMAELARVTRPGGQVALANWTREGFIGRLLAMHAAVVPPPPGMPSPLLWADEAALRERFDARTWQLTTAVRTLCFRYPHTPAGTAELFRTAYGPTVRVCEALDADGRVAVAADLAEHWARHARVVASTTGVMTEVDAEYLEVVAVRR